MVFIAPIYNHTASLHAPQCDRCLKRQRILYSRVNRPFCTYAVRSQNVNCQIIPGVFFRRGHTSVPELPPARGNCSTRGGTKPIAARSKTVYLRSCFDITDIRQACRIPSGLFPFNEASAIRRRLSRKKFTDSIPQIPKLHRGNIPINGRTGILAAGFIVLLL